ncbi:MAG TPA: enoyl-CoA hydratase-related protein, partial [Amaricoccus sp.]|nr:enoyl-CoA hydratase-related protein [Amaricoccus sp.]
MSSIIIDLDARGIARLQLWRPEKHNALTGEMCDEIRAGAARLDADPAVRAVVLT